MPVIGKQENIPCLFILLVYLINFTDGTEHGNAPDLAPIDGIRYIHGLSESPLIYKMFDLIGTYLIFVLIQCYLPLKSVSVIYMQKIP